MQMERVSKQLLVGLVTRRDIEVHIDRKAADRKAAGVTVVVAWEVAVRRQKVSKSAQRSVSVEDVGVWKEEGRKEGREDSS